jgi:hypothetical protein
MPAKERMELSLSLLMKVAMKKVSEQSTGKHVES